MVMQVPGFVLAHVAQQFRRFSRLDLQGLA